MDPFRQLIHGRVDRGDHRLLKDEAAARGISMTRCVGDVVREYFALRKEMLSVINARGATDNGHPGPVHSLVARMQEQLGMTIGARADELNARVDELSEGQRRIETILDRFVVTYLAHTPEVPPERRDQASASASRRYANFRQVLSEILAEQAGSAARPINQLTHESEEE